MSRALPASPSRLLGAIAGASCAFGLLALCACRPDKPIPKSWVGHGGSFGERVRARQIAGVTHHRFRSATLGQDVGVVIATPPGYATEGAARHPVVYVFPGIGGDEWTYLTSVGLDSPTLRTLFADPSAAPLLAFAHPGDSGGSGKADQVLGRELVAFVDATYRTVNEPRARSLEGFSLGGITALTLLTRHPETFGGAVAASSACYLIAECAVLRASLRARAAQNPKLRVLLSIGAREIADNRSANEELAPLFASPLTVLPGVDHDLRAQLAVSRAEGLFGQEIARFHLAGWKTLSAAKEPL